jgi:hypothetical protein
LTVDYYNSYVLRTLRENAVDGISLAVVIVAAAMLVLAAQRYFANKRLANERRNNDQS